jgi:Ca2+-binding EF-hand superfamily protein
MKKFSLLLLAATLATPAIAQNAAPPLKVPDERAIGGHEKINFLDFYDTNGDAIVSRSEFESARLRDYQRTAVSNQAVGITEAEYVAEFSERLERQLKVERDGQIKQTHSRFGVLDKNKDGRITQDEYMNSGNNTFAHFDSNKDGIVDEKDKAEAF